MMTDSESAPARDGDGLDEGAPQRPTLTRLQWSLVGAGIAILIGIASWVGWGQAQQPVRWQDVGYEIISPTEVSVTYEVYLYRDEPTTCYLRALNSRYAEVGVATQLVDPADGREQRFTTSMATVEEATTAIVRGCSITP